MRSTTKYRAGIATTVIGLALSGSVLSGTAVADPVTRPVTGSGGPARVTGSADVRLTYAPDKDVRTFTFDAVARPYSRPIPDMPRGLPNDATGTVRIAHWVASEGVTVRSAAKVDCLATAPHTATLTAVITEADPPVSHRIGERIGLTVYDGGRHGGDRMGFSWSVVNATQDETGTWGPAKTGICMGPAAFAPVTRGGYTVRHADLPPPPAARSAS